MKLFLFAVIACCLSIGSKAQDCTGALIQGYHKDTTVTVDEAKRVVLTSFAAINSCRTKLKLRSGSVYFYTADGDVVLAENFSSTLDDATKLRLIGRLKAGMKMMLNDMHYGDENIAAPGLSLTLVKGGNYSFSSK